MGRNKLSDEDKRHVNFHCKMYDEDKKKLEVISKSFNVTQSDMIRHLIVEKYKEMEELNDRIGYILGKS